MIRKLGVVVAAGLLLVSAGCGSDDSSASGDSSGSSSKSSSSERPTATELSASLQKGYKVGKQTIKLPKTQADCISKVLVDSDLSDKAVTAFAEGDETFKGNKQDNAALSKLNTKAQACAKPQAQKQ